MTLEQISRGIRENYGFNNEKILSGKISISEIGAIVKTVIESNNNGVLFFPDALYDSPYTRKKRLSKTSSPKNFELKKSVHRLMQTTVENNLTLYKFRSFIPQSASDNVWKPQTVKKAKTHDSKMHGSNPRVSTVERQKGRNGKLHTQGLIALSAGEYDPNVYQLLEYSDMETGVTQWLTYLSKVKDCRLERDIINGRLQFIDNFENAQNALGEWYVQSLRNRRNGIKRNPATVWYPL